MARLVRQILSVFSLRWRDPSPCPGCTKPFVCGATIRGCWCTDVKLDAIARADLRARFKGCLCRECLESADPQSASR